MALALVLAATGVFAVMRSASLSETRHALAIARAGVQARERTIEGLEGTLRAAEADLGSANGRLGSARDYGVACHTALGVFAKAFRMYYRYSRLASTGDVDRARALRREAGAVLRSATDEYRTCMSDAPVDEFSSL